MLSLMKKLLLLILIFVSSGLTAQVLDPNDPIVVYDENNPPPTPSWGTLAKWVISPSVNWNTDEWKSYYYNQVPFRLRYPDNYDPNRTEPYPMIVILHGRGFSNGTIYMNDRHLNNAGAQTYENGINSGKFDGFILSPQGTSGYFGSGQFNAIESIISFIDQQHNLDVNRVTVTGRSAGAQAVWRFISEKPQLFAAALPMSGSADNFVDGIEDYKYTPIWLFQGGLDTNPRPSTSENLINEILLAGGKVRYTIWHNSGHGIFNSAYSDPDFFPYMTNARKSNPIIFGGEFISVDQQGNKEVFEIIPQDEFCPGNPVNATLGLTSGFQSYEWRKDGAVIPGENSNELTITSFGVYDARFLRNGEWSEWSTVPVEFSEKQVTETPDIQVNGLASKVLPALDGSTSVELKLPGGFVQYSWYEAGSNTEIGSDVTFLATTPGLYEASVVEPYGCSSNRSQPFTVVDANGPNGPDPALGVVGHAPSETSIQLNWSENPSPSFNETGFEIYSSETQGGPYELIHITGADELSYLHENLTANKTVYYVIRAVNENGASTPTAEISVKTQVDNIAPTAPQNLTVLSTSPTTVEITWDEATDNVGVWKYDIYRNGVKSIVTGDTSVTVYNLIPEQVYNFKVKARDLTGNDSPFSNQVIAYTVFTGTPLANLKFNNVYADDSPNNVNSNPGNGLSFNDQIVKEGSHSLYSNGSSSSTLDFETGNQFIHEQFTTRTVAFWVYPESLNGIQDLFDEGGSTNGFGLRINNGNIELAVQDNHDIHIISSGLIAQEWQHIAGTFDNGELRLFVNAIEVASKTNIPFGEVSDHSDGSGIGGTNGSNAFDVANNNFIGYLDDFYIDNDVLTSSQLNGLMQDSDGSFTEISPEAPTNINAVAVSYNTIDISWTDNSDDETGFQVYRSTQIDGPYGPIGIVPPNNTTFSDTQLEASTTYYYDVISLGEFGQSQPPSAISSIAHLSLDNDLTDDSGNGVNSTMVNNPVFSNAVVKEGTHSIHFPGNNDYINLDQGNRFIHDAFTQRSLAFWLYSESLNGLQDIYDEGGSTNGIGIRINNGSIEAAVQNQHNIQSVSAPISANNWHHVAVVFDNGTLSLFIDGTEEAILSGISYSTVNSHGNAGGLGATNSSNAFDQVNNNFNGYIDDFYAFDIAIDESSISNLIELVTNVFYATTFPLPPPPNAPSGLTATAISPSSIELQWTDNSDDEYQFEIFRSTGNQNNFLLVNTIDSASTGSMNYVDTELFSNINYYYKIIASNPGGTTVSNVSNDTTLNNIPTIQPIGDVLLEFDTELILSILSEDIDGENLILSSSGLPSFVTLVDHGDGSGSLTFQPSSDDAGIYSNNQIIVNDQHGGADTTIFEIEVTGNHIPTLASVPDITLNEGDSLEVTLVADDEDGIETLAWNTNGLPAFAAFTSYNDATALLKLDPDFTHSGEYTITVEVVDSVGASASIDINISILDINPNQKVLVNIKQNVTAGSPWNNITSVNTQNLLDEEGDSTDIDVVFQTTSWKSWRDGAVTGNNSGVFPDNVINDYYYFGIFGAPETVDLLISGLDTEKTYNFEFLASSVWSNVPDNGHTNFSIAGDTISLYVQNNSQNTASFSGIAPNASGEIIVSMSKAADASVGYLNGFTIEGVVDNGNPPAPPTNVTAQLDNNQDLLISWVDAPYNEDGYEIERSLDGINFTILETLSTPDITSYIDETVTDNNTYHYRVRSFNQFGYSVYSDIVSVSVPNIPPTLQPVGDVTVGVNETLIVAITATDPPSNNISLSVTGLPGFASFSDLGEGAGEITINASFEDIGSYDGIEIIATDSVGDSRSEIISITVSQEILYSVSINFSKNSSGPAPWNNTNKTPQTNDYFGNLNDNNGTNSGIGLRIVTPFGGDYNQGATTGNNSGVVPDNVLTEYYWFGIFNKPDEVELKVDGLDPSKRYNFKFVGSTTFSGNGVTDNGSTVYKIGSQEVSVYVHHNTSEMGVISDVAPNAAGEVTVNLSKGYGAPAGYINAMIIEAYPASEQSFIPSNLTAVGASATDVQLNWEDKSFDETSFEVYRSETSGGPYTLLGSVPADSPAYTDATTSAGTIYYYQVRAIRPEGPTNFSNEANGSPILFSVYININGDPAYDAPIPWNNLSSFPSDGQTYVGFRDENSNETGIRLLFEKTMDGFNDWGTETGDDSGVFPDLVMKSFFFNDAFNEPGRIIVEGLDQSLKYNFTFFGAIETGYQIRTNFSIDSTTVVNYQTYNTSETETIYGVSPDINGEKLIKVQETLGSNWAIFNAMVIEAYPVPQQGSSARIAAGEDDSASNGETIEVTFGQSDIHTISIYPVPFENKLNIDYKQKGSLTIEIYDLQGQKVFKKDLLNDGSSATKIDLSHLKDQIYLLRMINDQGVIKNVKLFKK